MKRWSVLLLAVVAVVSVNRASAQSFDDTPLAACPGYIAGHPIVSDIGWTVNCFLQAVLDKNREIVVELYPGSRCWEEPHPPCDGIMDMEAKEFIFGPHQFHKSIYEMIVNAKSVNIIYERSGEGVFAFLVPRPGKARDTLAGGWWKSYIDCGLSFDNKRSIWTIRCNSYEPPLEEAKSPADYENDRVGFDMSVIDLNGNDAELPMMVWRPRKRAAAQAK